MSELKTIRIIIPVASGAYAQKMFPLQSTIKNSISVHRIEIRSTVIDLASTSKVHICMESKGAFTDVNDPTVKWSWQLEQSNALSLEFPKPFDLKIPFVLDSDFYVGVYANNYAASPTFIIDLFYSLSNKPVVKRY